MNRYSRRFPVVPFRLVSYLLSFVLVTASLPVTRGLSSGQNPNEQANGTERRRQTIPDYQLPNLQQVFDEGKKEKRQEPARPVIKPSDSCGFRDDACRAVKKERGEKVGQVLLPSQSDNNNRIASAIPKNKGGWRERLRKAASAIAGLANANAGIASSFVESNTATKTSVTKAASSAAVAFVPPFPNLQDAQLDARYRTGGNGEDLFSGNYHWSLPILSLPGRAGLDLNLSLDYNSLVWAKYGTVINFDYDYYPTLTPGFRTGFPELSQLYTGTVHGTSAHIVTLPSGRRVEMRVIGTNTFEAIDSSYLYLVTNPAAQTATLFSPDGTQYRYTTPSGVSGNYRCTKIVDRNGNFITINYSNIGTQANPFYAITTIVDTLGRVITFTYDPSLHLQYIKQDWAGQTVTWASFSYTNQTIQTNFATSLTKYGPANGTTIPVLNYIVTLDGSRYNLIYNSWGQVDDIFTYNENNVQLSAFDYVFPSTTGAMLDDCPRFSQRNDYVRDWAGNNFTGWVQNYFAYDPNETYGKVTLPNGVEYKAIYSNANGTRGLMTRSETRENGSILRQYTDYTWVSDSTVNPPLRPRLTDTNIVDDRNGNGTYQSGTDKLSRTTTDYLVLSGSNVRAPQYVKEYNEGGGTVYRTRKLSYLANSDYISSTRRIVGLPSQACLYSGDATAGGTLVSQTDYQYDLTESGFTYLQDHPSVKQHEGASTITAYQTGGQPRRGTLNKTLRYSVVAGTASTPIVIKTGYFSTGNLSFATDGIDTHKTSIFYDDAFTAGLTLSPSPQTYAYPTRVQDAENFSSLAKYHFDHGGVTEAIDPKAYATSNGTKNVTLYDNRGRVERTKVIKNGTDYAYTRYSYDFGHQWVQTLSTVRLAPAGNGLNATEEVASVHILDGIGRERMTVNEHPGSTGQLSLQYVVYDIMGRIVESSNPTEINSVTWQPAGDDTAGYTYSTQAYDWKSRPTVSTDQAGKTSSVAYDGCGCAGDNGILATDKMGRKTKTFFDVFGRISKTQTLRLNNTVYAATATSFDVRDLETNLTEYAGDIGSATSQQTVKTYDGYGRLKTSKRPEENSATTFNYYDNDQVFNSTDARGAYGEIMYNLRGLMTSATYTTPAGVAATGSVSFQYDQNGNRILMDDGPGQVSYQFDNLNRLESETRSYDFIAGQSFKLSYEYNPGGNLTKLTDAVTNTSSNVTTNWQTVNYSRDKIGRLTDITGSAFAGITIPSYASGIQYRAWGAPKTTTYGSGFTASATYTARMQPAVFDMYGVNGSTTTNVIGGTYTYNDAGQLTKFVAQVNRNSQVVHYFHGLDRTIGYDEFGRLNSSVAGSTDVNFSDNNFKATYNPTQNEFGNITNATYQHWMSGNAAATFEAQFANNRVVDNTAKDRDKTGAVINQTWSYDPMGNRTRLAKTSDGSVIQDTVFDALGRATSASYVLDGEGRIANDTQASGYHIRSSVLGGEIVCTVNFQGQKYRGRVLDGGNLVAEQLINLGPPVQQFIRWHHRDPLNLVSRDTEPNQSVRKVLAITPSGAQVETSEGVNTSQYYACLYAPNSPSCNSYYTPQAPGGYGPDKDKEHGAFALTLTEDGARTLSLWSPQDQAARYSRSGAGSVQLSPGLIGSPAGATLAGSFVRRGVIGWQEVAGKSYPGGYERDYTATVVDVWDFVPNGYDAEKVNHAINDFVAVVHDYTYAGPGESSGLYFDTIRKENKSNYSDFIIKCQIAAESRFNSIARGRDGEIGLMQIKPETASDRRFGFGKVTEQMLKDPATNIRTGTTYLGFLAKRFGGIREGLVAYNWGEGDFARNGIAGALALEPVRVEYADQIIGCANRLYLESLTLMRFF